MCCYGGREGYFALSEYAPGSSQIGCKSKFGFCPPCQLSTNLTPELNLLILPAFSHCKSCLYQKYSIRIYIFRAVSWKNTS